MNSSCQQNWPEIRCQYARHNEMPCKYICIDNNCKKKKIVCFRCFQDKEYHQNHQGLTIEEFKQKVQLRLENLFKLKQILQDSIKNFQSFIYKYEESVEALINKGKQYSSPGELLKIETIDNYFVLENDHFAPYMQQQLEKIRQRTDKITKFTQDFKFIFNEEDINKVKLKVIKMLNEKKQLEKPTDYTDAITELNKALKQYPTNCSLLSLKCTCLANQNQIEEAKKLNEYAFQINQNDETVLLFRAKLKTENKEYEECIQLYDLITEPNKYLAYYKLDSLIELKREAEVKKFLEQCDKQLGQSFKWSYEEHKKGSGKIRNEIQHPQPQQ
ncbi:unnamed protein product [Paramecium octaurelia]|uniref:Tetratricopeptide repeat protein n=1 Tax=Paramecium octaurelia TaxID=43137 RepID=A0A8S1T239_PAROT|nr:unnamed protein product [Paramecium octaurelia]